MWKNIIFKFWRKNHFKILGSNRFSKFGAKNQFHKIRAHRWEGDAASVLAGHGRGAGEAGGAAVVEALRGARDVAVEDNETMRFIKSTDKRTEARLRELSSTARCSQDALSRNQPEFHLM